MTATLPFARNLPQRALVALVTGVFVVIGLFSLAQASSAHAGTGPTAAKRQALTASAVPAVDVSPKALRAAGRRAIKHSQTTAHAAAGSAITIRWEWWGPRIYLDRATTCGGLSGTTSVINQLVPYPWNFVVLDVFLSHAWPIMVQTGTGGVEIDFSWFTGTVVSITPIGPRQAC